MKTQRLRSVSFDNKRRGVVALLSFVCLTLLVFTPGSAQLRNQRRVTAIQLGGASEGSRVTVVSDSALSDYEAFRRGNRFYLKLPLADLASVAPHFRGDGFEDVQVQKTGDGLIVSFKLQPGASARVDQHGIRLDVVFTAPNRSASSSSASSEYVASAAESSDRGRDSAGPAPTDGASAHRERFVSARAGSRRESRWPENSRSQTKAKTETAKHPNDGGNKNSNANGNKQPTQIIASASPSPFRSPSFSSSPGTSAGYQPLTAASPAAYSSPQSVVGATNPAASQNSSGLQSVRKWIASNRLATMLGALILLSLIAYLVMAIRGRQENGSRAKLAKSPKVAPRYCDEELKDVGESVAKQPSRDVVSQPPLSKAAAASSSTPTETESWVLTMPTIVTPPTTQDEHSTEEEDREVFEL
jgi:hypothetical protein